MQNKAVAFSLILNIISHLLAFATSLYIIFGFNNGKLWKSLVDSSAIKEEFVCEGNKEEFVYGAEIKSIYVNQLGYVNEIMKICIIRYKKLIILVLLCLDSVTENCKFLMVQIEIT